MGNPQFSPEEVERPVQPALPPPQTVPPPIEPQKNSNKMLYIIIAQKLNVPVYGVNLPQHFILAYTTEMVKPYPDENDVLFYLNPFNKGAVFTRREIELFIRQLKIKPEEYYFSPCTNVDIIKRLIHNLKYSYNQLGYPDKIEELENLLKLIE